MLIYIRLAIRFSDEARRASGERVTRAYNGVWEQSPQRVQGQSLWWGVRPPERECLLAFQRRMKVEKNYPTDFFANWHLLGEEAIASPSNGNNLWRVWTVFTRLAITPPEVNRFGWNLGHSDCLPLALVNFGRDRRKSESEIASQNFVFFVK